MANPLKVLPGAPTGPRPSVNKGDRPVAPKSSGTTTKSSSGSSGDSEKRKAANRLNDQARQMGSQIQALKDAIKNEFARSRKQNISDVNLMLNQQFDLLKGDAEKRGAQFLEAAADADKATADVQEGGFRNLVRERADTLTSILEVGAGETDAVKAMLMNARNWNANASDASRSYFDTMQSINQGITDLNIDTKTSLANAHTTAQGAREQIWQDYYNRRSEAMTALGNTYGDQLNLMNQAKDLDPKSKATATDKDSKALFEGGGVLPGKRNAKGKGGKGGAVAAAEKGIKSQFAAASNELGKSYVQRPLPEWIAEYEGTPLQERRQENTNLAAAPIFEGVQKAQGATLRTW